MDSNLGSPKSELTPGALVGELRAIYEGKSRLSEFEEEKEAYDDLLPVLIADLRPTYELQRPLALGSTATVWIVFDCKLKQKRALKLSRPRLGKLRAIVRVFRAERERLASLNHQNIIKIYGSGEIQLTLRGEEYEFPYFVMEFLEGVRDFSDFLAERYNSLETEELLAYFRDIMSGLQFLHSQNIIHCDIKPGNLLVAQGRQALIADLGYAKHLPRIPDPEQSKLTQVTHTPRYAHPELIEHLVSTSDSAASRAEIPREKLSPKFDLFAFGRTMQELLALLREKEKNDPERGFGHSSIFTAYQWQYLGLIAKRLLDGIVKNHSPDDLVSDLIQGLPDSVMGELKYPDAAEALEGIEKLLHLYDLEAEVPELNPNLSTFIQIPHCRVPLTKRVREVINHPSFARLAQVTQLGFVSLVYPGAAHTRFEHVLGSFAHCCEYLRALWYDQRSCLFQCVMSKTDIELALLAALLHDIGQYPMAHDLTEIATEFAHEQFTYQALRRLFPGSEESLAQVISIEWGVRVTEVVAIIRAGRDSPFRHRLLNSLISGPLDCDKIDYLRRDSSHLGVNFGLAIDHERILRNLTVVYGTAYHKDQDSGQRVQVAAIGVTEKALVVAQALWKIRKEMFRQVYWQHTARALKAMLSFVVTRVLSRLAEKDKATEFWGRFQDFIFDPIAYCIGTSWQVARNSAKSAGMSTTATATASDFPRDLIGDLESSDVDSSIARGFWLSPLSPTDDAVLRFLWDFATAEERSVIEGIRLRRLYRRLAVLSAERDSATYDVIYDQFRVDRLRHGYDNLEQQRKQWQRRVVAEVSKVVKQNPKLTPIGMSTDEFVHEVGGVEPLILVDVPIKVVSRTGAKVRSFLEYFPEDASGRRELPPAEDIPSLDLDKTDFDKDVGKVRVFAHPTWCDDLARCLTNEEVFAVLSGTKA